MVLLSNIVEIFNLAAKDRHVAASVGRIDDALFPPLLPIATSSGSQPTFSCSEEGCNHATEEEDKLEKGYGLLEFERSMLYCFFQTINNSGVQVLRAEQQLCI
jgi:hypothetical protein